MRRIKFFIISFLMTVLLTSASAKDVIFLGISAHSAPSIEKSLNLLLKDQLAINPQMKLVDDALTQRYINHLDFDNNPALSKEQLQPLHMYHYDSTIIIWGIVKECTIIPIRENLIRSTLKGTLVLDLYIYNLENQKYQYIGAIKSEVKNPKGWIFFETVQNGVHVSVRDQITLHTKLQEDIVQSTIRLLSALRNPAPITETETESNPPTLEKEKEPSISDVFSIPSLEAAPIDSNQKEVKNDTLGKK